MPRMVFYNDPHFSRTEPECRDPSYPGEILDKLHAVARLAAKVSACAIACTGDHFHRKGKVTFHEANDLLAVLAGWRLRGIPAIGILGNHDIAGYALESMSGRAVGSMVHSKLLHLLDGDPWSHRADDGAVYVTGTSYFHGCDASDEGRLKMYGAPPPPPPKSAGDEPALHVHLAHGALIQKGSFFEDFTVAGDLVPLLHAAGRLPDVIVCGHLHFNEGVRRYPHPEGGGRTVAVCRVGSVGRVAADDLDRVPVALVMASKGRTAAFKEVPLAAPLAAREGKARGAPEEREERIREFVRVLRAESEDRELADHRDLVRACAKKMGFGEEVAELALAAVARRT